MLAACVAILCCVWCAEQVAERPETREDLDRPWFLFVRASRPEESAA